MKIMNDECPHNQCRQTRTSPRGTRWFIWAEAVLVVVITFILTGCGSEPSAKSPGNANKGDAKSNVPNGKAQVGGMTEDQAREKLKVALDSWVFGDDDTKLKRDHPEIKFLDTDFIQGHKLLKYDLGAGRTFEMAGFEFAVALSFASTAGTEIKETRPFWISKDEAGKWVIMKTPR